MDGRIPDGRRCRRRRRCAPCRIVDLFALNREPLKCIIHPCVKFSTNFSIGSIMIELKLESFELQLESFIQLNHKPDLPFTSIFACLVIFLFVFKQLVI